MTDNDYERFLGFARKCREMGATRIAADGITVEFTPALKAVPWPPKREEQPPQKPEKAKSEEELRHEYYKAVRGEE